MFQIDFDPIGMTYHPQARCDLCQRSISKGDGVFLWTTDNLPLLTLLAHHQCESSLRGKMIGRLVASEDLGVWLLQCAVSAGYEVKSLFEGESIKIANGTPCPFSSLRIPADLLQ